MDTKNIILDIYPTLRPTLEFFDHEDVSSLTPSEFLEWCLNHFKEIKPNNPFVIFKDEEEIYNFRIEQEWNNGGIHIPFGTLYKKFSSKNKELLIEVAALCRENFMFWFESYFYDMEIENYTNILIEESGEIDNETQKKITKLLFDYVKGKIFAVEKRICHKTTFEKVLEQRAKCRSNSHKTKLELDFIDQMLNIYKKNLFVKDGCIAKLGIPDDEQLQIGPTETFLFIWEYGDPIHDGISQTFNQYDGECQIANPIQYTLPDEMPTKFQFYFEFSKLYDIYEKWKEL